MGGPGSGSWYRPYSKTTVEDMLTLSLRCIAPTLRSVAMGEAERVPVPITWSRRGEPVASILVWVEAASPRVPRLRLVYATTTRGERTEHDYHVTVVTTRSNLPGNPGRRWWYRCPACWRRVAKLYGGKIFACRTCHNLTYTSCQESHQMARLEGYLAGLLAAELGGAMSPDDIAAELRSWRDPETVRLMAAASRIS